MNRDRRVEGLARLECARHELVLPLQYHVRRARGRDASVFSRPRFGCGTLPSPFATDLQATSYKSTWDPLTSWVGTLGRAPLAADVARSGPALERRPRSSRTQPPLDSLGLVARW